MLDCTGALRIDTLGISYGSDDPIATIFLVADESINDAIICFASASILLLVDDSGV